MDSGSVPIIKIEGRYLFKGPERFIVRGIVYQSSNQNLRPVGGQWSIRDSLDDANIDQLRRDVDLFEELNINTLWVYCHDATKSHKASMDLLASHGIYVIFGAAMMLATINRRSPMESYNEAFLTRYCKVVDSVAQYRNTLGVCLANQVIDKSNSTPLDNVSECQLVQGLVTRDLKTYMRYRYHDTGQRILPLCISDSYWSLTNTSTFEHMTSPDSTTRPVGGRLDFYCFSNYVTERDMSAVSHFGTTVTTSADESLPSPSAIKWKTQNTDNDQWTQQIPLQKFIDAEDPVPILVSEYGTVGERPRRFTETRQLYGKSMDSPLLNVLSGGFAYEFRDGSNRLGMVGQQQTGQILRLADFVFFGEAMRAALGLPSQITRTLG